MHLFSNQTVMNLEIVDSVLMILVPELKWTWTKLPRALWMSFASSLRMIKFTVDWLSRMIHHGLIYFTDPWVLFPLFGNGCLSVPPMMHLLIPLMLA